MELNPQMDPGGWLFTPKDFIKDLTGNRDDENPVILTTHNGQGTNATQLLA